MSIKLDDQDLTFSQIFTFGFIVEITDFYNISNKFENYFLTVSEISIAIFTTL